MPFSLHEQAYYALLALSHEEWRMLNSIIELIASDPMGSTQGIGYTPQGRKAHVHFTGRFLIYFTIRRSGDVFIYDILKP